VFEKQPFWGFGAQLTDTLPTTLFQNQNNKLFHSVTLTVCIYYSFMYPGRSGVVWLLFIYIAFINHCLKNGGVGLQSTGLEEKVHYCAHDAIDGIVWAHSDYRG
jgi:hypothetical protein